MFVGALARAAGGVEGEAVFAAVGSDGVDEPLAELGEFDGLPCHAALSIGPYSVLIFSQ